MKKLLSALLALVMLVGIATTAFAAPLTEVTTVTEDGVTYTITTQVFNDERVVTMTSDADKDKLVIEYVENEELTITEYEHTGSSFFGLIDKYDKTTE